MDPQTTSTNLKHQHPIEWAGSRRNFKASKLSIDLITLTKGDLHDICETMCDVNFESLLDFMQEN